MVIGQKKVFLFQLICTYQLALCEFIELIINVFQIVTASYTDLQDYTYYFVPAPWLSVKLLRLLQNYTPPGNFSIYYLKFPVTSHMSVSYTHLDVYKRQDDPSSAVRPVQNLVRTFQYSFFYFK